MAQNIKNKIYIPDRVKNVQISVLPISTALSDFFEKHEIQIVGDLQSVKAKVLDEIVNSNNKPFPELRHYILAFQESESSELVLLSDKEIAYRKAQETKQSNFDTVLSKTIFIPMPARNWKISTLPISQQLIEKIKMSGCSLLNDLQEVSYLNFFKLKSFEKKDVLELYTFLAQLQSEKVFPSIEALVVTTSATKEVIETNKETDKTESSQIVSTQNTNSTKQTEQIKSLRSTETIQTPPSLVEFLVEDLAPSDKLAKLLKKGRIFHIGHLNGNSFYDLEQRLKLDAEDVSELQSLMAFAKKFARYTIFKSGFENIKKAALKRRENEQVLKKTSEHKTNNRSDTNDSNENAANRKDYFQQITRKTISQEQTNNFPNVKLSSKPQKFDLPELMSSVNEFTNDLPQMEREIFLDRFGGSPDEQILTYREISEKLQLTPENTYQKYLKVVNWLKDKMENSSEDVLKKIYDDCFSAVCPLMPKFLVYLVNNDYKLFQFPVAFYIRIFGFLMPEIPILPEIENQIVTLKKEAGKIEKEIEIFLDGKHLPISLPEIFNYLMNFRSNRETAESNFFKAVQSTRFNLIMTGKPNELYIELKGKIIPSRNSGLQNSIGFNDKD